MNCHSQITKTVFVGRETMEIGVNSAIIHFNDGRNGIFMVLEHFGLKGEISTALGINLDDSRIKRMEKRSTDAKKKHENGLRAGKKGFSDKLKEKK